jgi:hypothetical protein
VELLRKQGWLVHGIRQMEPACNLLAHIPYELIVIDAEVSETGGIDYLRLPRIFGFQVSFAG